MSYTYHTGRDLSHPIYIPAAAGYTIRVVS